MLAVKTSDLTKKYGKYYGVDNINIAVESGEVFGIVGSEGAGKTTLLRLLMNFVFPTAGSANIFGNDIVGDAALIKETTGYVPAEVTCYPQMKAGKYIKTAMKVRGIKNNPLMFKLMDAFVIPKSETFEVMDRSDLKATGIAGALVFEPKVLFLDQPTTDLTGDMQDSLFQLLEEEKAKGTTIIITAEDIEDLGGLCDRVAILERGEIVAIKEIQVIDVIGEDTLADGLDDEYDEYHDDYNVTADTILLDELMDDEPTTLEEIEVNTEDELAAIAEENPDTEIATEVPETQLPQTEEVVYAESSIEDFLAEPDVNEVPDMDNTATVALGAAALAATAEAGAGAAAVIAETIPENKVNETKKAIEANKDTKEIEYTEVEEEIEEDIVNPKVVKITTANFKKETFEEMGMAIMSESKGKIKLAYAGDINDLAAKMKALGLTSFSTENKNLAKAFGVKAIIAPTKENNDATTTADDSTPSIAMETAEISDIKAETQQTTEVETVADATKEGGEK